MSISTRATGEFIRRNNEDFYVIKNVDQMPQFFISLVSDQDHWLFAGSHGGITAGRVSPETALFSYACVDKIYDTALSSGPRTFIRSQDKKSGSAWHWEPFNYEQNGKYKVTRNIYKNTLGNILVFEECNHDLNLAFEYQWSFSDEFGICRHAKVINLAEAPAEIEILDGLVNVLPAGTPRFTQTVSSNLVDAYKWTELDPKVGLAKFSLYSAITDRAEPAEALRANTAFLLGLEDSNIALSKHAIDDFKQNKPVSDRNYTRGVRGCFLVNASLSLSKNESKDWLIVTDLELDQIQISNLAAKLKDQQAVVDAIEQSVALGSDKLSRIMASSDGFQVTNEKNVAVHHYANTLFNVLRGGIFANQYHILSSDLAKTVAHFNKPLYERIGNKISSLEKFCTLDELKVLAKELNEPQFTRLLNEYLPITFGRRHGDPSRPWNQFAIELKDAMGKPLLSYQGNWRDIFQNWEALALSFPAFTPSMIAKFVNASTMDGYNPYRITKQGIDWEVEEPDDPWSYIGYWGDHQIIYLLKLLEVSNKFYPSALKSMLQERIYSYANVPYRIKSYEDLCADPKATVDFDEHLAELIDQKVRSLGADGKLILQDNDEVYQVNLIEKLLVPLLAKLSNLVVDGGIWLNTQRPEWNDANNALVGQGLSMVTLYYMHRYIHFFNAILQELRQQDAHISFEITSEVAEFLQKISQHINGLASELTEAPATATQRKSLLDKVGRAASEYRSAIYSHTGKFGQSQLSLDDIELLLSGSQSLIKHSISHNTDDRGLYHAYNILTLKGDEANVGHLYKMLEGQVAALSSGALDASQSLKVLKSLFESDIYREDIDTFMLYPDREQVTFMQKNLLAASDVEKVPLLTKMVSHKDTRLIQKENNETYRFNADIINSGVIKQMYSALSVDYPELANDSALESILELHEQTFNHSEFTGRSGGMFGFEGLGCVYWHMVAKLLLAVQEVCIAANDHKVNESHELNEFYYRVRRGIGFNKTPENYGAFPTDPYSHTPKHAGAQQPGMTGQVKEEVIARFGELGCLVQGGIVSFDPFLLRPQEFTTEPATFKFLDVSETWQELALESQSLGFTWCQVPIVYHLSDEENLTATVKKHDGSSQVLEQAKLSAELSADMFARNGNIAQISVNVPRNLLCSVNV